MNINLTIGIAASILFHVGLLYGGEFFKQPARSRIKPPDNSIHSNMVMTTIEEEPEVSSETNSTNTATQVVEFAPPVQAELFAPIDNGSFVQIVQPNPPEGITATPNINAIPQIRDQRGTSKMPTVYNPSDLEQAASPRYQTKPVYPYEMQRTGVDGVVDVGFIVNANGTVQDAYIIRSTHREFEASAVQAVLKWKFRPGKKAGKAVASRMQIPIVFSIVQE